MSKINELKAKYPRITTSVFNKFVEGDVTKTKKYLPFMLKTWINKNALITNSGELVKLVKMFDELLPYIENKDIYHKNYENISYFLDVINNAIDEKEEKTFNKEDHINVIFENERYILLQPKTHKGSCKYGANTKWCTASKKDEGTFNRYSKDGYLLYLLSKSKDKSGNYEKVAFYSKKRNDPFFDSVETYNTIDNIVTVEQIVAGGWDVHELFTIISIFRANFSNWKRVQFAKENLKDVLDNLSKINFSILEQSIKIVENDENSDYINDIKNRINEFIKKIPVKL